MVTSQPMPNPAAPTMQPSATVATLLGHEYAVRKVAWSPHSPNILASASYDMSARIWSMDAAGLGAGGPGASTFGAGGMGGARLEAVRSEHTEFVVGVAWSYFQEGVLASCSWDQSVICY